MERDFTQFQRFQCAAAGECAVDPGAPRRCLGCAKPGGKAPFFLCPGGVGTIGLLTFSDTFHGFRIAPYHFGPPLFSLDISFALEPAVSGSSGGGAAHFDLEFIPSIFCKRRIDVGVVS